MALVNPQTKIKVPTPRWHAPWELSAVISGHLGWVRSIAFDPSNEWFATGSADRTIKVSKMQSKSIIDLLSYGFVSIDLGLGKMLCWN